MTGQLKISLGITVLILFTALSFAARIEFSLEPGGQFIGIQQAASDYNNLNQTIGSYGYLGTAQMPLSVFAADITMDYFIMDNIALYPRIYYSPSVVYSGHFTSPSGIPYYSYKSNSYLGYAGIGAKYQLHIMSDVLDAFAGADAGYQMYGTDITESFYDFSGAPLPGKDTKKISGLFGFFVSGGLKYYMGSLFLEAETGYNNVGESGFINGGIGMVFGAESQKPEQEITAAFDYAEIMKKSDEAYAKKDYATAAAGYSQLSKKYGDKNPDILKKTADSYYLTKNFDKAIKYYYMYTAIQPNPKVKAWLDKMKQNGGANAK